MSTIQPSEARTSGVTARRVAMAAALVAMITGAVWALVVHSQGRFDDQIQLYNVDETGQALLSRLTDELDMVSPSSVLPAILEDSTTISYRRDIGWEGAGRENGNLEVGPVFTIAFEAPNTRRDRVEGGVGGRITLTPQGGPPTVLADEVLDLRFNSTGDAIRFRVELGVTNNEGVLLRRSYQEQVACHRSY